MSHHRTGGGEHDMHVPNFTVKGFKNGSTFYILKNREERFDVYQVMCEVNAHLSLDVIRQVVPDARTAPDEKVIIDLPNEEYQAFLILHDIGIIEMNRFRITFQKEEIVY